MSLALLESALNTHGSGDFQRALLHALQAQRPSLEGRQGLQPRALSRWAERLSGHAFPLRWRSPSAWLGGPVTGVAFSHDGTLLASGADRAACLPNQLERNTGDLP
jgi:hypothetical protein